MIETFHYTEADAYACYYAYAEKRLACKWPREKNGGWIVEVQADIGQFKGFN